MKVHHYSKALSWITRPRVTETATAETYTPELERMNFKPEKSKADQYKEYLKAEPFLEPESQIYARDQLGFDEGGSAQLVQPGQPGVRQGYGADDKLGKSINLAHPSRYKEPVYQLSVHFPPEMKKKQMNISRKATPENLKMMKKLRAQAYEEIDTFYGPNRMTTEEILKFRDKYPTLTSPEITEKLKGKVGPRGEKITATGIKKAALKAGKKGQYGKITSLGRNLEQLKEQAAKLPSGKKYLDEYNKATNKDEALKLFRTQVSRGLGNLAKDPEKVAIQRAAWAKTESGAKSIEKSLEKQSALRMERYGIFNPGRKPEQRLFHSLWRSSQQEGSRWKLIGKKPDRWTTELSQGAKFLDTKNNKIITLDGLKKYMDTTPDVGSYKSALRPFEAKEKLQKYLVNYKGKEYKLGNLLNERLFTGDDWKSFKTGTSEIVINHPERVKNNWWKGEVSYKDANKKLNDIETKFLTKMKRADNDQALQKVIKNQFTKDIKKLGPITSISPYGRFGTKPTSSALIQSMVKPLYKKTQDKTLSRALNTLVKSLEDAEIPCAAAKGGRCDTAADYRKGFNELVQRGAAGDKAAVSKLQKFTNIMKKAKGPLKWTGYGLLGEIGFMVPFAAADYTKGESWKRIIGNATDWGFGPMFGQSEDEEIISRLPEGSLGAEGQIAKAASERLGALTDPERTFPQGRIGMEPKRFQDAQARVIEEATSDINKSLAPFMVHAKPGEKEFSMDLAGLSIEDWAAAQKKIEEEKLERIRERRERGFIAEEDWMQQRRYAGGDLTRTVGDYDNYLPDIDDID